MTSIAMDSNDLIKISSNSFLKNFSYYFDLSNQSRNFFARAVGKVTIVQLRLPSPICYGKQTRAALLWISPSMADYYWNSRRRIWSRLL